MSWTRKGGCGTFHRYLNIAMTKKAIYIQCNDREGKVFRGMLDNVNCKYILDCVKER